MSGGGDKLTRIAIVDGDKCKPKKCRQECKRSCPVVRMGKLCIEVSPASKVSWISEELCIGCGICVKKCPFTAITIINLPKNLDGQTTHRYGPNAFKLHRLPMPRPGQVLGLVGTNGIGKTTALMILANKLKPNLGRFASPPDWSEILLNFRGSELQNFFTKLLEDNIKAIIKPQYVDSIPRAVKGKVLEIIMKKDDRKVQEEVIELLELHSVLDREISNLSGGELQRFAIAVSIVQTADMYMFDEPSSYLDVRQRLRAAQAIRNLCSEDKYVVCVEHDLSVLDYLSDFVCCLYGKPGAYGVVTAPFSVREGINIFLAGFVPTENLRFRPEELTFKVAENVQNQQELQARRHSSIKYPNLTKTLGTFKLNVKAGGFSESEIVVMLGQNGTGKCWARGSQLLRYDGTIVNVEDVREGELLMGEDSEPRKVNARSLCHSRGQMFRVVPAQKGRNELKVNGEHILVIKISAAPRLFHAEGRALCYGVERFALCNGRIKRKRAFFATAEQAKTFSAKVKHVLLLWEVSIQEWLKSSNAVKQASRMYQPNQVVFAASKSAICSSVEYCDDEAETVEELSAFLAGYWLRQGTPSAFSIPVNATVLDACQRWSHLINEDYHVVAMEIHLGAKFSTLINSLYLHGMCTLSHILKTAATSTRRAFVTGLFNCATSDTVTVASSALALDIDFVCKSLGCSSFVSQRTITIDMPSMSSKTPSSLSWSFIVEPSGEDEYFGFTVSGRNQRFLMADLTVTHNTTFIKMLAGLEKPDGGEEIPPLNVSYKPQKIAPKFEGTVRQLLHSKIRTMFQHPQFNTDVIKPLNIEDIIDQEVLHLSGGELQRVALTLALGKPADIYLIDEPSAYLDSEQRIHAAKVIKRYILHSKKTAFIVEHDFIMATYLADRVIVYEGTPAVEATANSPQPLLSGMNAFLKDLSITFRRDPTNHRPRINKLNSVKDKEQKLQGTYFYLADDDEEDVPESKSDKKKREKRETEHKKDSEKEEKKLVVKKPLDD